MSVHCYYGSNLLFYWLYRIEEAEPKENEKDDDEEGTTTTAEDTAAHENGGNGNMNALGHENIDLSEENIEDDIDHTLYSSEDEDNDFACVWRW